MDVERALDRGDRLLIEIDADAILKATQVDGIYSADPRLDPDAEFIEKISYMDILRRDIQVMDATAVSMCKENDLPIVVFDIRRRGAVRGILAGESIGSIVAG